VGGGGVGGGGGGVMVIFREKSKKFLSGLSIWGMGKGFSKTPSKQGNKKGHNSATEKKFWTERRQNVGANLKKKSAHNEYV